jgi:microcin C transport system substrate-binding protein
MRGLPLFLAAWVAFAAHAAPGYSVWGTFKYAPGFDHFDYVNPDAPKGGELRMVSGLRVSTFDKYNPFILKGQEPAYESDLLFEGLLTGSMDEVGVGYGLLADDVQVAPDGMSVTFHLRKEARFHNGDPVLAEDVKYSFDTLNSKYASPIISGQLVEVAGCDVVDDYTVRYRFKRKDRLLPLTVGGLPVFSRKWGAVDGKPKRFDQIVNDIPIATGPYRIGPVVYGRDVTYVRDPNYWARDLPVRRGMNNFDRITVKIYRDNTARLEALKAGEFDLMEFFSAGDWTRRLNGKRIDEGDLVKSPFMHRRPDGFPGFVLNLRRPKFQDRRVREALDLALDYQWMNRMLFRGAYTRVNGVFGNTDCEAKGTPPAEEVKLMAPFRAILPPEVFGPMKVQPTTDPPHSLRQNLLQARSLLAQAGWTYRNGALRNAGGEPFVLEFLDAGGNAATTVAAWQRALEKLGITLTVREVDFALYQERTDAFDFDVVFIAYSGTHLPGQDYIDYFGSKSAAASGSNNYGGVKSPAIDALLTALTGAENRDDWLAACRALDRVIAHETYMVPGWTTRVSRVAYSQWKLERPAVVPPYPPESLSYLTWPMTTWWARMPPITKKQ